MRFHYAFLVTAVSAMVYLAAACKTVPPSAPLTESSSAVVAVVVEDSVFGEFIAANKIYYIKIEDSKNLYVDKVYTNNYNVYSNGENVYLLNAELGQYAIVGYSRVETRGNASAIYYQFFDEASIRKTIFTIEANSVLILGRLKSEVHEIEFYTEEEGPAQKYYGEKIAPGTDTVLGGLAVGAYRLSATLVEIDNSDEAKAEITSGLRSDWEGTRWSEYINKAQ